jgi:hypothetical protein
MKLFNKWEMVFLKKRLVGEGHQLPAGGDFRPDKNLGIMQKIKNT